jgi:hypothetical protein
MQKHVSYFRFGFLGVLIELVSCAVGPKYHPPVTQAPPAVQGIARTIQGIRRLDRG